MYVVCGVMGLSEKCPAIINRQLGHATHTRPAKQLNCVQSCDTSFLQARANHTQACYKLHVAVNAGKCSKNVRTVYPYLSREDLLETVENHFSTVPAGVSSIHYHTEPILPHILPTHRHTHTHTHTPLQCILNCYRLVYTHCTFYVSRRLLQDATYCTYVNH